MYSWTHNQCMNMTSPCPYAHVPYGTLRLWTFQQLFSPLLVADRLHRHCDDNLQLSFLRSSTANKITYRPNRRAFHASSPRSRSFAKDVHRTAKFKNDRIKKTNSAESTVEYVDTRRDGNLERPETWNPYSDKGLEELQSLVSDLHQISRDQKSQAEVREVDIPFEHGSVVYKRADPKRLESPFERKASNDLPSKKRVEEVEVDKRLAGNVWAKILASPSRLDRGTKARLPRDLLSGWGIMQKPGDKEHYILPIELSDTEALKREIQRRSKMDGQPITGEVEVPGDSGTTGIQSLPELPKPGTRTHIMPWKLLVAGMTEFFTTTRPRRAGDVEPPVKSTNSLQLGRALIPVRWRINRTQAEAFAKTRERFNQSLQRSPSPDEDEVDLKNAPQLNKLQWQMDIASRLERILCERVLIALEAVGKDNVSRRSIYKRKVCALEIPQTGRVTLDSRGRNAASPPLDGDAEIAELEEADQAVDSLLPDWISGAMFLHVGKSESFRRTVERWHNENYSRITDGLPPLAPNDLIPPMITIEDRVRVPVFDIDTLFENKQYSSRLRQILETNKPFDPEFWGVEQGSQQTGSSYLVLVKPQAVHASILAREIWLLWRYIGGRSGLYLNEGEK